MITCFNVFNVWPKTTLLLPVWPRDAKMLDTPAAYPDLERTLPDGPLMSAFRQCEGGLGHSWCLTAYCEGWAHGWGCQTLRGPGSCWERPVLSPAGYGEPQ